MAFMGFQDLEIQKSTQQKDWFAANSLISPPNPSLIGTQE
jgi:hypothetical protein